MSILRTRQLKKYYGSGDTLVKALDGVDLSVEQGEFLASSGNLRKREIYIAPYAGRSGLSPQPGKRWKWMERIFPSLKEEQLTIFRRRKIGFVFQSYNLVPVLNVYENIVLPVELDGNKVDREYVEEIIEILGLKEKTFSLPSQLSGGQQQRVAIARALASKPAILLADEPTGNLDSVTSQDVLSLLKVTSSRFGQTVVMITHNDEIAQMADRIIRIEDGKIRGMAVGQEGQADKGGESHA